MTWPYDDGSEEAPAVVGRTANLMVPIGLPGHVVNIHMIMPEADARAIVNSDPELASSLGPLYELIKDSLTEFLAKEG